MKNKKTAIDVSAKDREKNMTQKNIFSAEGKRGIEIIQNNAGLSEAEVSALLQRIYDDNLKLQIQYYAQNTPVKKAQQRTFADLVKLFFERRKEWKAEKNNGKKKVMREKKF